MIFRTETNVKKKTFSSIAYKRMYILNSIYIHKYFQFDKVMLWFCWELKHLLLYVYAEVWGSLLTTFCYDIIGVSYCIGIIIVHIHKSTYSLLILHIYSSFVVYFTIKMKYDIRLHIEISILFFFCLLDWILWW